MQPNTPPPAAPEHSESELLQIRRDKLDELTKTGVDAFGGRFDTTHQPGALKANFEENLTVSVAGRILSRREMGKATFFDLGDISGRMQCYLSKGDVGDEAYKQFNHLVDIGDFVGIEGFTFITKRGEKSIHVKKLTPLSKALRPLPDKWHGVTDKEIKYRQRYLDLISNEKSQDVFRKRIQMVAAIRSYMQERGFLEVETPMMQDVPGGAAAKPFETFFHALNQPMFLRIAPELYLKRLLVAGFTQIFELNRNFRNEGLSRRHNPEFTMLEAYWAYADFEKMADLVEGMICHLAENFCGGLKIEHKDEEGNVTKTISLARPWKRARYTDLLKSIDPQWYEYTPEQRKTRAKELGVEIGANFEDYEVTQHVFERLIEAKQFDPLYVTHCPKELVPLAKQNADDDSIVDVYELVINGQEISPGYSELNDPIVQRDRLEHQAGEETQKIDEEFILALEHGMPPAGGIGIGIDRLIMMLTGAESIRDVILFPQLKRKD
ncbi:MAG: lysine--tRNA ligase [Verrucomicrobiaceae bacterium]|nr:lysine--tRNA ligase [Verrucomicrobiaceae bacterium]